MSIMKCDIDLREDLYINYLTLVTVHRDIRRKHYVPRHNRETWQ
jgi:hypothetical protein